MRLSIWLNALIVVALIVAVSYSIAQYLPIVPRSEFAGPLLLLIFYVAVRIFVFARQSRGQIDPASKYYKFISIEPLIIWLGQIAFGWSLIVSMPYADEPLRMATAFFFLGTTAVDMLLTVKAPPSEGFSPIGLLIVPMAVTYVLLTTENDHGVAVAAYYVFFTVIAFSLNRLIQGLVNQAHADRERAEKAMAEVAFERDLRSRFFTSAAHDLGQPLQSARLFLEQAARADEERQRARSNQNVRDALGAMERLLRRMLDHLRLDAGAITPSPKPIDAGQVIGQIASQFAPVAALAGMELVAVNSSLSTYADPDFLERALGNLVDNALRHSGGRRVLIGARKSGLYVRFWVIDDGKGVPKADLPALFDEFVRGSGHGDQERGGFGLGLASVRRMASLMNGKAGIEVNWSHGSAFFLDLPSR